MGKYTGNTPFSRAHLLINEFLTYRHSYETVAFNKVVHRPGIFL